jgi:NAD(P)-dependent dehydrogenase (short-subunit alcohol dehydrogenase family)
VLLLLVKAADRLNAAAAMAHDEADVDGQRGVIVQTASISAYDAQVTMVPYAAAKGGVTSMVPPMARGLALLGISGHRTRRVRYGAALGADDPGSARTRQRVPETRRTSRGVRHPGRSHRADAVSQHLNAQVICVDGGARLWADMIQDWSLLASRLFRSSAG